MLAIFAAIRLAFADLTSTGTISACRSNGHRCDLLKTHKYHDLCHGGTRSRGKLMRIVSFHARLLVSDRAIHNDAGSLRQSSHGPVAQLDRASPS